MLFIISNVFKKTFWLPHTRLIAFHEELWWNLKFDVVLYPTQFFFSESVMYFMIDTFYYTKYDSNMKYYELWTRFDFGNMKYFEMLPKSNRYCIAMLWVNYRTNLEKNSRSMSINDLTIHICYSVIDQKNWSYRELKIQKPITAPVTFLQSSGNRLLDNHCY